MIESILAALANFVVHTIHSMGYFGVISLMAIESANIPLPSEVIMPFSGYLVSTGVFNLWLAGLAGAIGCVVGSVFSYWLGLKGGRPFVDRYGKYIFISSRDLDKADKWFLKYGEFAIFISRLLPVVRTFISFPAGVSKMHFKRFVLYTFIGSFIWSIGLAYIGLILGNNWDSLKSIFHRFDYAILVVIILGVIWYIWRHLKHR